MVHDSQNADSPPPPLVVNTVSFVGPGCRFFYNARHPVVTVEQFLEFVDPFLPRDPILHLSRIPGQDLFEVAEAKKSTAGVLDGWAWNEVSGLDILLNMVENTGIWPQELLDAYITMIPKIDGDSTPSGQRPLCVLSVIIRLWASLRLTH